MPSDWSKLMKTDLTLQLQERYPDAFPKFGEAHFTFECGEGWYPILETLCSLIVQSNQRKGQRPTYLESVEEKLGSMRVLVSGRAPESHAWITFAEQHSTRTCEVCGRIGCLLFKDGWQRARCEDHLYDQIRVQI